MSETAFNSVSLVCPALFFRSFNTVSLTLSIICISFNVTTRMSLYVTHRKESGFPSLDTWWNHLGRFRRYMTFCLWYTIIQFVCYERWKLYFNSHVVRGWPHHQWLRVFPEKNACLSSQTLLFECYAHQYYKFKISVLAPECRIGPESQKLIQPFMEPSWTFRFLIQPTLKASFVLVLNCCFGAMACSWRHQNKQTRTCAIIVPMPRVP